MTIETFDGARMRPCVNPACGRHTVLDTGICPRCRDAGYVMPVAIESEVKTFHVTRSSKPGDENVPESDVQKACIGLFERQGWTVRRVGQRNAKGTMDSGYPDATAMKPRWGLIFAEFKKPVGGAQSAEQWEFEQDCIAAGVRYWLISSVEQLHGKLAALTP